MDLVGFIKVDINQLASVLKTYKCNKEKRKIISENIDALADEIIPSLKRKAYNKVQKKLAKSLGG